MDRYDDQAAVLLPCHVMCGEVTHYMTCPAYYRPAVAAALRDNDNRFVEQANAIIDQAHQLAQAQAEIERLVVSRNDVATEYEQENAALRSQLAEAQAECEEFRQQWLKACADRDWNGKQLSLAQAEIAALRKQLEEARKVLEPVCERHRINYTHCTCSLCLWLAANREGGVKSL